MATIISYAAVVDDNPSDAAPLINVLSMNGAYAQYYNGEYSNLPATAPGGVRILFLDLHLNGASSNEKNMKSKLIGVLTRLIGKSNGPYIIVAWTEHVDDFSYLKDVVNESKAEFEKPIGTLPVRKAEAKENGDYDFAKIEGLITSAISKFPAMQFLMQWEKLSIKGVRNTTTFLTSEARSDDESLRCLIQNLARAELSDIGDTAIALRNSLLVLNKILLDELDGISAVQKFKLDRLQSECKDRQALPNTNGILTRKLNIRQGSPTDMPGALYVIDQDTLPLLNEDKTIDHLENQDKLKNMKVPKILLDVSPMCDYSQGKLKLRRFLPGYMFQLDYGVGYEPPFRDKGRAVYLYHTTEFDFESKRTWISLNLKFFTGLNEEQCRFLDKPIFTLREALLSEIQHKLASHVERVGTYTFTNRGRN